MNDITFTIGQNGYRIQIAESCAVTSVILAREAVIEQSIASLRVLTVQEKDHVWEGTVREHDGIRNFEELISFLRGYAEDFDVRYPAPMTLSRKSALRFEEREHKSPVRLRTRLGDSYPGGRGLPDRAAIFDERATTEKPNQPSQRNASTGSVSNLESPARRG